MSRQSETARETMQSYGNLAVLVVDDFESMRKITTSQLRALGIDKVVSASDGAEALRMLAKNQIDIVLSDWNMPGMNGIELLKAMRVHERWWRIPFVMVTAETERRQIEKAVAAGVSDLMVKPYSPDRFVAAIDKALRWKANPPDPKRFLPAASDENHDVLRTQPHLVERATLLVVDDAPDNLHLLVELFKDDYHVRVANSGKKALEICASAEPPDLVLLDVMMPELDGFAVAQQLRETPSTQGIPVIFVTALDQDTEQIKGLDLGAIDFVTKPINPDHLQLRVRNLMRYVMLRKQLQSDYDSLLDVSRIRDDVEHLTRHDMKGALAGIIGMVQHLASSDVNQLQQAQLHTIEETSLNLLNMINLTAELYKIETGRFELHATDINIIEMLRRIVALSRATFVHKKLVISIDADIQVGAPEPHALGDTMLTWSVFQNLIKNACEAAPEGSRVEVKVLDQNPLCIEIHNKGVVPMEIRDTFFEKYVTVGKKSGTGLGTYSARMLTNAQDGSIRLDVSDSANTTQITVCLPRQEQQQA